MHNILDNLIADGRIPPVTALFIDPRTDITDSRTSTRIVDYAMSDTFVAFLVQEFIPRMREMLPLAQSPARTGILGCSLGGLIATYAAFRHPEVFGFAAAQSPAYWWNDEAMITLVREHDRKSLRLYLDTGTLRDAAPQARTMRATLEMKGYPCTYAEYPEGHNWVNWRSHIDDILVAFLSPSP
jgi:enterochelin esterase family protein